MLGPDVITGNHPGPYNATYPGSYGANAAVRTWQVYRQNPTAIGQATIQLTPAPVKQNPQAFMANLLGYSAEDFKANDSNQNGAICIKELTHWFGNISQHPQTAAKLAHQWLNSHDVNNDKQIDLTEHTASVLLDTNASGYLNGSTPAEQASTFYQSTGYSTPQQRNAHHTAMFNQPQHVNQTLGRLITTFNLTGWLRAFGLTQ